MTARSHLVRQGSQSRYLRRVVHIRLTIPRLVASPAARAGIMAASATVASTFSRGLLPRSVADQALVTGVCSAAMYQMAATVHAGSETLALLRTGDHGMRGRTAGVNASIAADLSAAAVGAAIGRIMPSRPDEPLPVSVTRFVGESLVIGGVAGATVTGIDEVLGKVLPKRRIGQRSIVIDAAVGGAIASLMVYRRHQRAREYGLVEPKRKAVKKTNLMATAKGIGIGAAAAGGLLTLAAAEQASAHAITKLVDTKLRRFDIGSPLIGHGITLGLLGASAVAGFSIVKRRIETGGDVVEPAYPHAPMNPFVTAGPRSVIDFDTIGKEGRRFVLMAMSAEEISEVMGEPAKDPVRVVAGFEAAGTTAARADLCLQEMEAVGAFDRSIICIASPTGVGYVSYTVAESLEYLARGDCAIVMPQYALVPSALALFDTHDGVQLQKLVLKMTRDRIATMPADARPKLVQFGESLGAQVALDVSFPDGSKAFDELGLDAGLYMGVPFRSKAWNAWRHRTQDFDPSGQMIAVSEPARLDGISSERRERINQVMVIHYDDPVNKFSYRLVVKEPWWMGAPTERPPMVPRETIWRPVVTFMRTLMDLKNGMDFKPGEFRRRGHDYRIDACESVRDVYGLPCSEEQREAIDLALREREQEWATKRLVARKFAGARASIRRTLKGWGVSGSKLPDLEALGLPPDGADINPQSDVANRLGSAGIS